MGVGYFFKFMMAFMSFHPHFSIVFSLSILLGMCLVTCLVKKYIFSSSHNMNHSCFNIPLNIIIIVFDCNWLQFGSDSSNLPKIYSVEF